MKKIALLGDSIRLIGYGTKLAEVIGDEFAVWQPDENCRFSLYTLRNLKTWQDDIMGADLIHWNNGLWDVSDRYGDGPLVKPDVYVDSMLRIARVLKTMSEKIVFATTTPVRDCTGATENNADITRYNELIVPKLTEMGIFINDLNSVVSQNVDEYICEDNVHLSPLGIDVCADAVARVIKTLI